MTDKNTIDIEMKSTSRVNWLITSLLGLVVAIGLNILAFALRFIFGQEMDGTIISVSFFSIGTLITGIILTFMFKNKKIGWPLILGGILSCLFWSWIFISVANSSYGW